MTRSSTYWETCQRMLNLCLLKHTSRCMHINSEMIVNLLWADDLKSFSEVFKSLNIQLNGLKCCSNKHIVLNDIKWMQVFDKRCKIWVIYMDIEKVRDYILGNVINLARLSNQDPLERTNTVQNDQAQKVIFGMSNKIQTINSLLIWSLTYSGEWQWCKMTSIRTLVYHNKASLQYPRYMLDVKATTHSMIVVGECGRFSPSTCCQRKALWYHNRLQSNNVDILWPDFNLAS